MAEIKNIVKVMNFHSLLRIDKSKAKAEKYFAIEQQLDDMMVEILYNKNLNLDKKIIKENPNGEILNIYIGNDLGFCSNFNSLIKHQIIEDTNAKKIVIGKKIFTKREDIILSLSKEEFYKDSRSLENILYEYVEKNKVKEIHVIYNHYYKVSDIRFENKKIFPLDLKEDKESSNVDFVIETDVKKLLMSIVSLYLCYEIKILETNSWASENVMREKVTRESLKKIDEIEEEKNRVKRKKKKAIAFKKQLSNFNKVGETSENW